MGNLYERIHLLCSNKGITPGKLCSEIGISRGNITDLKVGRIETLSAAALSKIADYFHIPIDFLLGRAPFDFWDSIEANRKAFIDASSVDAKLLSVIWNIDFDSPEKAPLECFLRFINEAILFATPNDDGAWNVEMKENFKGKTAGPFLKIGSPRIEAENLAFRNNLFAKNKDKAPAVTGERKVTFDDFTYAMQNEATDLTEEDKSVLLSMARQLNAARKKKESE